MLLLPATLTANEAKVTLRMLQQALKSEGADEPVVVDAGSLVHFDSSALAVLLEVDRLAGAWGRTFSVRSAPPKLAALAKLYGIDALLLRTPAEPGSAPVAASQRNPAT